MYKQRERLLAIYPNSKRWFTRDIKILLDEKERAFRDREDRERAGDGFRDASRSLMFNNTAVMLNSTDTIADHFNRTDKRWLYFGLILFIRSYVPLSYYSVILTVNLIFGH